MRYVFEQYDKGVSKKQIAAALNAQGYRVKGKPVTHKTFDHYLTNPKYTGEFYFGDRGGEVAAPCTHNPLKWG